MTITHQELGVEEDLGRRILVRARIIAPCIQSFPDDSEAKKDAIAILKGVIAELPSSGSSRVRSKTRNGTAVTYADIDSAFTVDDRTMLASLCAAGSAGAVSQGSFPADSLFSKVWPEGPYA